MATMKSKKAVLANLYEQFKMNGLTTSVSYEEYVKAVGGDAITRRTVKKGWGGRWPRVTSQLAQYYPDINKIVNPVSAPVEKPKKEKGLDALKTMGEATAKEE